MPTNSVWERIRRARMVRVLLVYLGAAWGVLEVADLLQESLSLPSWVVPVAILLLLIGLVIILATAWVQAGAAPGAAAKAADGDEGGEDLPGPWEVDPKGLAQSLKQGRLPHLTWGRSILGGVFAFWFLFGLAGLYVVIKDRGRSFAPTEAVADVSAEGIAIVPFTVRGSEDLDVWREGMVDLLSTSLDDVGGYRTIDSRTVMARWSEAVPDGSVADLATTLEVAKRTGARYAVSGSAVGLGDQVRLAAEVYDVSSGGSVGTGQVEGPADSVLSLVNQLAVQSMQVLLRQEGGEGVTARAAMSLTTASLPALKAYLEGETYFRRADFDRAIEAYERALTDDPDLALAHFRLADAYGWSENITSERGYEHLMEAERLADRLSHRDRAILDGNVALIEGDVSTVESVREITRRYPDDPDAWFLLSEFYFHHGDDLLLDWDDIGGVFDKPVELEPRFAPYYVHQFDYAVIQRDTAGARRAMENLRLHGSEARAESAELAYDLVLGDSATQAAARASVRGKSDGVLLKSYPDLWTAAGRPVAFEPVFLEMQRRRLPAGGGLGSVYMMGGKADAAERELTAPDQSPQSHIWKAVAVDGWVRGAPREVLEAEFVPGVCGPMESAATHCAIGLGKGLAELGSTEEVAAMVAGLRTAAVEAREAGDEDRASNREQIADALDAYGRAQSETGAQRTAAISDLKDLQGTGSVAEPWIRGWLGELLLEEGQLAEAARYFEAHRHSFLNALANYRLGGIYQELGEAEKARAAYIRFLQAWEEADPGLPQLETARAALKDLLAG